MNCHCCFIYPMNRYISHYWAEASNKSDHLNILVDSSKHMESIINHWDRGLIMEVAFSWKAIGVTMVFLAVMCHQLSVDSDVMGSFFPTKPRNFNKFQPITIYKEWIKLFTIRQFIRSNVKFAHYESFIICQGITNIIQSYNQTKFSWQFVW